MKRPSWPTIILGFLNIIAAGFLLVLASRAFYARVAWDRHMDDGKRYRDGMVRYGETDKTDETEKKLIEGLSEQGKTKVAGYQSRFAKRQATGEILFEPLKDSISKLQTNSEETKKLANDLGPKDFQRLMQNHFLLRHPELRAEEQQIAQQKATVLFLRENYSKEIKFLEIDIERLKERHTAEKDRTQLQLVENEERKKELSNLYAELQEMVAARNLADGRLKDLQDLLALTKKKHQDLAKLNTVLEEQIRKQEGIATRGE